MPRFMKIRCDHCGKEYDEEKGSVLKIEFQRSDTPYKLPLGNGTYYLCANCENQFAYWLLGVIKVLECMYPDDPNELPIPPMPKGADE